MIAKLTGRYRTTTVAGESVQAFVPNPLPPMVAVRAVNNLADPLRAAETALVRLEQAGRTSPDRVVRAFLRREALLSSEIEGIRTTLTDVFSYELMKRSGSSSIDDIEEVTNYVAAINYALAGLHAERGLPISVRLLNECHGRLMLGKRSADKQPGEIRRTQNWIGGTRPGNAVFVPPPPDQLAGLLSNLERYIHNDNDLPLLLRIAAIHAQFETIHPYLDGNGRVGRMLITLLLDHCGLLASPLLYLSLYLKENQSEYYRLLGAIRTERDWQGWFEFFLRGVESVATDAAGTVSQLCRQVSQDRQALLAEDNVTVSAIRLFDLLPENPVITMPVATQVLDTTKPTASKAMEILQNAGILVQLGKRKRNRVYAYRKYLRHLD